MLVLDSIDNDGSFTKGGLTQRRKCVSAGCFHFLSTEGLGAFFRLAVAFGQESGP